MSYQTIDSSHTHRHNACRVRETINFEWDYARCVQYLMYYTYSYTYCNNVCIVNNAYSTCIKDVDIMMEFILHCVFSKWFYQKRHESGSTRLSVCAVYVLDRQREGERGREKEIKPTHIITME